MWIVSILAPIYYIIYGTWMAGFDLTVELTGLEISP